MATIIDQLIVSLRLDGGDFKRDADNATKANKNLADGMRKSTDESDKFARSVNNGVKALTGLFSALLVSSGLRKLIDDTAKANDQLNFLSKNLGMSADSVKAWQGAAALSGGTADGMSASLSTLNKSLYDLVTVGDTSILPYFNALGVSVVKSDGQLRGLTDILLDLSDSMAGMDRPQAYNLAKHLGFDDGTINMLLQGRHEVERQLALQKQVYTSSAQELGVSRELNETQALANRQWDGLKIIIGNYLAPYFLKFAQVVQQFFGYLNQHRDLAIGLFKGISAIMAVSLIPLALKAGTAFIAMFAPLFGGVGLVLMLAGAIALLANDYETWKRGGDSLIDWGKWAPDVEKAKAAIAWLIEKFGGLKDGLGGWTNTIGILFGFFVGAKLLSMLAGLSRVAAGFTGITTAIAAAITGAGRLATGIAGVAAKNPWLLALVPANDTPNQTEEMTEKERRERENWAKNNPGKPFPGDGMIAPGIHLRPDLIGKYPSVKRPEPSKTGAKILEQYKNQIAETERKNGLPPGLLRSLAITESGGDPSAVGPMTKYGTAKGAFQFVDSTAKDLGITDPHNFQQSLEGAGKYMAQLLKMNNGNLDAALASYNWGVGNVMNRGMDKLPQETRNYIPRVMSNMPGGMVLRNPLDDIFSRGGMQDMSLANDFIGQTDRLNSQSKNITNNTTVQVGGITVQTTANTIKDISEESAKQSISQVYQMTPSVS